MKNAMSRHKPVNIKRGIKINRQSQNSNVLLLKLVDPIGQFAIFIYFLYCLDANVFQPSYRSVLLMLVAWQMVSACCNLFYKDTKALRRERLAYIAVNVCYMALFFFLEKILPDKTIGINELDDPYIHVYQVVLMGGVFIIAFWYNVICYREVKSLLSGASKNR